MTSQVDMRDATRARTPGDNRSVLRKRYAEIITSCIKRSVAPQALWAPPTCSPALGTGSCTIGWSAACPAVQRVAGTAMPGAVRSCQAATAGTVTQPAGQRGQVIGLIGWHGRAAGKHRFAPGVYAPVAVAGRFSSRIMRRRMVRAAARSASSWAMRARRALLSAAAWLAWPASCWLWRVSSSMRVVRSLVLIASSCWLSWRRMPSRSLSRSARSPLISWRASPRSVRRLAALGASPAR